MSFQMSLSDCLIPLFIQIITCPSDFSSTMGKIKKGNDLSWQRWWESEWHYYAARLISAHSVLPIEKTGRARAPRCKSLTNWLAYHGDVEKVALAFRKMPFTCYSLQKSGLTSQYLPALLLMLTQNNLFPSNSWEVINNKTSIIMLNLLLCDSRCNQSISKMVMSTQWK